tara:strand:- start:1830 stop:2177 length:348 start_codon:yes stop_codon:yes gene_type:complete
MFISTNFLKDQLEKFNKMRLMRRETFETKEEFTQQQAASAGVNAAFTTFMLVIAIIFFTLELILLFYAINVAISCTQGGSERVVHVVMSIIFTLPYMLLTSLFSDCAKDVLKGNK